MTRAEAQAAFLAEAGWSHASIGPLAGDASNRRYLRLTRPEGTPAVLMDAPPEPGEDVRPFAAISHWLRAQGFSAPEILAEDAAHGFLLLEDLGDDLFARWIPHAPGDEDRLYRAAIDLLVHLAHIPAPQRMDGHTLDPYDLDTLRREWMLFADWWLHHTGVETGEFAELAEQAFAPISTAREVVVLRDYHAENLIWLPGRSGIASVGLLDFQDALAGHAAYDLVSLLEDARRDTSPELRASMIAAYLAARPELDAEQFRRDYTLLGAQRNLKIIGIFTRLAIRDRKARYLELIPRVWGHLAQDLAHPELSALRTWVERHSPAPDGPTLARLRGKAAG